MKPRHAKMTQAQQELFVPDTMRVNPFALPEKTNGDSGCARFPPLALGARQTPLLTPPLPLLSGLKTPTWIHDLWPFPQTLPVRALNEHAKAFSIISAFTILILHLFVHF